MWAQIQGYEGLYEVSDSGDVRSMNYNHTGEPRILTPKKHSSGYNTVVLCKNSEKKNKSIHILVAQAFVDNPDSKPQVNHKDGNKENNNANNLEWVTASENIHHSFEVLGKQSPNKGRFGESHYASVRISQYSLTGHFVKQWNCISDAAREIGCQPSQIINNIKGRSKTCRGYMWRYEKCAMIDDSPVKFRKTHKNTGL